MARLGMSNLRIGLDSIDGDKESLVVSVDNGGEHQKLDIGAYSGGQLGRVEIALKQALSDLISSSRGTTLQFLFYDEPTDGLDENGKTALLDFLYERSAERFKTTMVVSHDPKLLHAFQNRLRVVASPNGTKLEVC
jgi:DNA repair exonuclease SbcCD ATPase subunit